MSEANKMKTYECHKRVNARPMTRGEYNQLRGWGNPANENPADEGYLIEYPDGGKANHPDFAHYISWSPKEVFEKGYNEVGAVDENGLVTMTNIDQFAQNIIGWHERNLAVLRHMTQVPEGTPITIGDEEAQPLKGDLLKGFGAALTVAIGQIESLPFQIVPELEDNPQPSEAANDNGDKQSS